MRPTRLDDVIGQNKIKQRLRISIQAAKETGNILPHTLFCSAFGQGKTTFAEIIANELNTKAEIINGANLRNVKALLPCLARIEQGSVLFCDEIHKCSPLVQTYLLSVLESFKYTLGKDRDSITIDLPRFTFVGATTDMGGLLAPLINRFTYQFTLEPYSIKDLSEIILANSRKIGLDISEKSSIIIAAASRNTPRTALNRLRWIFDYATANKINYVEDKAVIEAFKLADIGLDGTEPNDRKYLDKLKILQPCGVNTLASALNIDVQTVEKSIEPFLIQRGLIKKTKKGRMLNGA